MACQDGVSDQVRGGRRGEGGDCGGEEVGGGGGGGEKEGWKWGEKGRGFMYVDTWEDGAGFHGKGASGGVALAGVMAWIESKISIRACEKT